jgi:hypothetical protein
MKNITSITIIALAIVVIVNLVWAYQDWAWHHTFKWERRDHFEHYGNMRFMIFEDGKTIRFVDTVSYAILRNFKRIDSIVIMEIK